MKNKASKGYEENYFFIFREGDGVYYNELETRYSARLISLPLCFRPWGKAGRSRTVSSRLAYATSVGPCLKKVEVVVFGMYSSSVRL